MGWGTGNLGGGSGGLNFKVVGYATEAELLADTPKENTIGIITTNKITGWMFAAADPAEPVEGMVYITTGTKSDIAFNALKKNGIMVYPLSAKQYIGSSLTDVPAMIYKSSQWVSWIDVIDFDQTAWTFKNPFPSRPYTLGTYDLSGKTLKGTITGSYQHVVMVKNAKINFADADTLNFVYDLSKSMTDSGSIIVKISSSNSDPTDSTCVVNQQITENGTNKEVSVDVASVNGSYYLWIGLIAWGDAGTVNFEVSNLRLK